MGFAHACSASLHRHTLSKTVDNDGRVCRIWPDSSGNLARWRCHYEPFCAFHSHATATHTVQSRPLASDVAQALMRTSAFAAALAFHNAAAR